MGIRVGLEAQSTGRSLSKPFTTATQEMEGGWRWGTVGVLVSPKTLSPTGLLQDIVPHRSDPTLSAPPVTTITLSQPYWSLPRRWTPTISSKMLTHPTRSAPTVSSKTLSPTCLPRRWTPPVSSYTLSSTGLMC